MEICVDIIINYRYYCILSLFNWLLKLNRFNLNLNIPKNM